MIRMRANGGADVIVVNLSLGDATKPFSGKILTWARAIDYLAFTFGILFLISAGNTTGGVPIVGFATEADFLAASAEDRAAALFRGSGCHQGGSPDPCACR